MSKTRSKSYMLCVCLCANFSNDCSFFSVFDGTCIWDRKKCRKKVKPLSVMHVYLYFGVCECAYSNDQTLAHVRAIIVIIYVVCHFNCVCLHNHAVPYPYIVSISIHCTPYIWVTFFMFKYYKNVYRKCCTIRVLYISWVIDTNFPFYNFYPRIFIRVNLKYVSHSCLLFLS